MTLSELEKETPYWVRVRAVNEAGESPWTDPMFAFTSSEATSTTTEAATDEESENEVEEHTSEANMSDGTFYGIFFAGGIFVVTFVCVLAMRMVK